MAFDEEKIEGRIDRVVTGDMTVSRAVGGVAITTMNEVFEFAKMMAISQVAVPKHLRGQPGVCLAICVQAFEWQMSPFAVANKSYAVNDRLAYESQLIHAVIEARAPLEKRLRDSFKGEGDERQCTISGTLKGDATPFEITSPKIKDIAVKNSPLWKSDPDQQLFYYTSRAWARRYVPDVLLGIYSKEEIEAIDEGPSSAVDVTPGLGERISAGKDGVGRGFSTANIDKALQHKPGEPVPEAQSKGETVAAVGEIIPPKKRSHHKKKESRNVQEEVNDAGQHGGRAGDGKSAGEAAVSGVAAQGDAGAAMAAGDQVAGEEAGAGEQAHDEPIDDEPTAAQRYAEELMGKVEAHLNSGEIKDAEELRGYKAAMRVFVDSLEGLSSDEMDQVRGRFSTLMLTAEKAFAKKGRK